MNQSVYGIVSNHREKEEKGTNKETTNNITKMQLLQSNCISTIHAFLWHNTNNKLPAIASLPIPQNVQFYTIIYSLLPQPCKEKFDEFQNSFLMAKFTKIFNDISEKQLVAEEQDHSNIKFINFRLLVETLVNIADPILQPKMQLETPNAEEVTNSSCEHML